MKASVNFKSYNITDWQTNNNNTHNGQCPKYNKKIFFFKIQAENQVVNQGDQFQTFLFFEKGIYKAKARIYFGRLLLSHTVKTKWLTFQTIIQRYAH